MTRPVLLGLLLVYIAILAALSYYLTVAIA